MDSAVFAGEHVGSAFLHQQHDYMLLVCMSDFICASEGIAVRCCHPWRNVPTSSKLTSLSSKHMKHF